MNIQDEIGENAWVLITEVRPPIDEPLLVWCRTDVNIIGQIHRHAQHYIAKFTRNGEWQLQNDSGYWNWSRLLFKETGECLVTHWRYLPKKTF